MELILVATSKKHEIVKVTLLQLPQLKMDLWKYYLIKWFDAN